MADDGDKKSDGQGKYQYIINRINSAFPKLVGTKLDKM
jgi:hypothetical protein